MDEELANDLLDDMDFDRYGKVKCLKIEGILPKLMKMAESEMKLIDKQLLDDVSRQAQKSDRLRSEV